jgi:hypothetical protein
MATTVITGRDLAMTIDTKNYDEQATSATLSCDVTIETYDTLFSKAYKSIDSQWTFDVEMLADWGATNSLCEALWSASEVNPNTPITVVLTAVTGAVFTFSILPVFPSVGGASPDAQTVSMSFTVIGTPTENFS